MRDLYKKILEKYGLRTQEDILLEEMSELQKAILKNRRYKLNGNKGGGEYKEMIAEELADVEIVLEQIKMGHGLAIEVSRWRNYKLNYLKGKLEEG